MNLEYSAMSRRHISFVLALSVSTVAYAAPALSQAACAPEKLNAAVDAFAAEPFSAATWRMRKFSRNQGRSPHPEIH